MPRQERTVPFFSRTQPRQHPTDGARLVQPPKSTKPSQSYSQWQDGSRRESSDTGQDVSPRYGTASQQSPTSRRTLPCSPSAQKGVGGGAGRDRDWRARNDNLGGWRDSAQALPKCPPTPPIELWDCDVEEAAAAATTAPVSTPTCLLYTSPSPRD